MLFLWSQPLSPYFHVAKGRGQRGAVHERACERCYRYTTLPYGYKAWGAGRVHIHLKPSSKSNYMVIFFSIFVSFCSPRAKFCHHGLVSVTNTDSLKGFLFQYFSKIECCAVTTVAEWGHLQKEAKSLAIASTITSTKSQFIDWAMT